MSDYTIKQIDGSYVVLALGEPQLSFKTRAAAEAAIRDISRHAEEPAVVLSTDLAGSPRFQAMAFCLGRLSALGRAGQKAIGVKFGR